MDIVVILKQVPDLVEELELNEAGTGLDTEWLKWIVSEFDDHALEQALLLKEQHGGTVHVLAIDKGDVDESLYAALAKGADSAAKIVGDFSDGIQCATAARLFRNAVRDLPCDLVLGGVQHINDLYGQVVALTASLLEMPYTGVVCSVKYNQADQAVLVRKEYPGGLLSELKLALPAVIGIQAADKPPRYVPIARIRQMKKTGEIKTIEADPTLSYCGRPDGFKVRRMYKPEPLNRAEMIEGDTDEIVSKLMDILTERGIVR